MHKADIIASGREIKEDSKVLIMLHGRGGSGRDILSLVAHLEVKDYTLLAPQATNNTWYPYSFMAPPVQNEPWLSSALSVLEQLVSDVQAKGTPTERIYFLGFSQGACLTLEYVCRHAARYGGVVAFTGGLIGDKIYSENYGGDFMKTPMFLGTSDPDPHVPVERVHATTKILERMNAKVTEKVYANMGHTINQEEIALANGLIFNT